MKVKMTIDECLDFADEWSRGVTMHEDSVGWRVVCMLLAEEVRKSRSAQTMPGERNMTYTDWIDSLPDDERETLSPYDAWLAAAKAEREACKADCRKAADVAQEMYGFDAECIATVDECLRIIDERSNIS